MERHYDLVVIGTGIASGVASRCREAGWTVAVVDSRPFGGTCALRGCVPKKILVSAAEAVHAARDMDGIGVPAGALAIDWPQLMKFKRSLVDPTPERTEQSWAKIGVDRFHGRARFVAPTTLAVGDDRLVGRRVLIAAGAMPVPLKFPGAERLTTSEQFLNLDSLPRRVAFVGGGYIAFEFAHVAARAGARVTIIHRGSRPLEAFDPDLVDLLVKRTREVGIGVELAAEVGGIPVDAERLAARARNLKFRTNWQDTSGWFNTRRVGETTSGFKVLIAEDTGRILGAHLLGPHADEVINVLAVAVRLGIPAAQLKDVIFAYPTNGSDVKYML